MRSLVLLVVMPVLVWQEARAPELQYWEAAPSCARPPEAWATWMTARVESRRREAIRMLWGLFILGLHRQGRNGSIHGITD